MKLPSRAVQLLAIDAGKTAIRDCAGLLGFGLVAKGAAMIYLPAGYIVAGAGLLIVTVMLARSAK